MGLLSDHLVSTMLITTRVKVAFELLGIYEILPRSPGREKQSALLPLSEHLCWADFESLLVVPEKYK